MRRGAIAILLLLIFSLAQAKDFGLMGKTYAIAEVDFLTYIQEKIKSMQDSGQWSQVERDFKKRVKAHIIRPTPTHLPRAEKDKKSLFNPSIEVPYDVRDVTGRVIVQKSTVVNPLDRVILHSTLIFFDGDDKAQITWVKDAIKEHKTVKLILTSGSIKTTTDTFKQAVYFDLNGFLINKFHITALPAFVKQEGYRLAVNEVAL